MIKHKQKTPYGCGMYAVANALNIDNFITEERLEQSKSGNTMYQLNKWLEESGYAYNIECMYFTVSQNKESLHGIVLPKEINFYSDSETKILPLLLNVKKTASSRNHLIAGCLTHQHLILIDSLKEETQVIKWEEINQHYDFCYGVWMFQSQETLSGYICFERGETVNQKEFSCAS